MNFQQLYPQSFVHLHLHTQYSLLDGAIRINDLVKRVQELGMPAVAQTDHGNMFGAIDFYKTARKAKIKPILGSEIYFTPGSRLEKRPPKKTQVLDSQDEMEGKHHIHHLVLLAKNLTGYQNLCKLISKAYLEGFYYKPRTDLEILKEYSEGLIATTACLKGEVGYNFFTNQDDRSLSAIVKLQEIYGDDFYLEIQENGINEQSIVNQKVLKIAQEYSIPLVATNDCHYLLREDASAQEVLLCVQTGKTFADEARMKLTTTEFYVKSPEEMRTAFHYAKEACDNTLRIADLCNLEFRWLDDRGNKIYHLPRFEIPQMESEGDYFRRMAKEGLEKRFAGPHFRKLQESEDWEAQKKIYYERLDYEVEMIIQMEFTGYFLIVFDFIKWAKENHIPVGPGRGSGVGSLVAYSLNITNINPLPFNLLFERFINPERISLPDFDVDFCQDRRGEVIDYVTKKYGHERVGQIITFGKLQAKAVIRDVARVFNLPYSEADMIAKLVPDELGITLERAIETEPKLKELEESDPKIRQVLKISRRLEGLLRHASIHAAGVIITNEPLVNYCPLFRGRDGEQVVQFDKDFSEEIGLVKFDFLGLKTLTVIDNASQYVRKIHDANFDIDNIDRDDPKVYELISSGDTTGVFQLESSGMKDLCKRIKPDNIEDITAINALYRPGPLGSGMVDDFIEIKHGRKVTTYPFPELIPVLRDTYGIIVYQEQVMNIARIVAGYSLGQADILRKAMGKKKADVMAEHREVFRKGAISRGLPEEKSLELFDLMAKFAEYGFNKSHAVAYAEIAYQTAYLKTYYRPEFFAALLSTELGNTDKVTGYIKDAEAGGIKILPPDINESLWSFNVVEKNIRFGLGAIKNVGENAVKDLLEERQKNGPYLGVIDFCERVNLRLINKRVMESLVKVGVFDRCETLNRKTIFNNLEAILQYASKRREEKISLQSNLFNLEEEYTHQELINLEKVDDFEAKEKLAYEMELLGIYVSGHPLKEYQSLMRELTSMSIADVLEVNGQGKRSMTLSGLLTNVKTLLTKKGDRMAFATLEDLSGKIDCVIFPRTFLEFESLLNLSEEGDAVALLISGEVNLSEEPKKFFPQKLAKLEKSSEEKIHLVQIKISMQQLGEYSLSKVKKVLQDHRGVIPVKLVLESEQGEVRMKLGEDFLVQPTPKMAAKINEILNRDCVRFIANHRAEEYVS